MFRVTEGKRQFTHDVSIMEPVDGGFREDKLKTTFNALDKDEVEKFDIKTHVGTNEFLAAIIDDFHDLQMEDGRPLECTPEIRARLLAWQNIRHGLLMHYFDAVAKVKTGN